MFIMKAVFIYCVALLCGQVFADDTSEKWADFQAKFSKNYKSAVEASSRFGIFEKNLEDISLHNERFEEGKVTWKKGINQFSDWTRKEFLDYVNNYKYVGDIKMPFKKPIKNLRDIPQFVDWRVDGGVGAVKNQGQCGASWAFSAIGAIEAQFKLVKGVNTSLSEQNLIDCANGPRGYKNFGCSGGVMLEAFRYVKRGGIEPENDYPYEAAEKKCRQKKSMNYISGYYRVPQDELSLKLFLSIVGPISVTIEATENLQNYKSGVLYDEKCSGKINHGVLLIGYGTVDNLQYWLMKNSWGSEWGEHGFFRLSRKDNNCGTTDDASYPILV